MLIWLKVSKSIQARTIYDYTSTMGKIKIKTTISWNFESSLGLFVPTLLENDQVVIVNEIFQSLQYIFSMGP